MTSTANSPLRPVARIVAAGLVLVFAFTALYVTAFHAPHPRGEDVGVVGPPALAARVQSGLDAHAPGAFDVRRYGTEAAARSALLDTTVLGVLVPGAGDTRVLVAGALGVAPTEAVTAALRGAAAAAGAHATVQDLRPLPAGDRRGLAPLFIVLGTLIPSLVFGLLLTVAGGRLPARARWAAVAVFATLAGVIAAFDADVLAGALEGHFVGIAVVAGLLALAVAATSHGLGRLGGPAGLATAVALLLLLGVSSAGGAVTARFEPGFYGAISPLLPPGAALTAVRDVQYFDWAGTLAPLLTLGAWALGGLAAGLLGERAGRRLPRRGRDRARVPVAGLTGPPDAGLGQRPDLVLGQREHDGVGLELPHGAHGDGHVAPAPQVAVLEHDVRDVALAVDHEALDVAGVVAVGRDHRAGPAQLDLALGHAVVGLDDMRVEVDRAEAEAVGPGVVGQRVGLLDAHVPVRVLGRELAESQVGRLAQRLEPADLLPGDRQGEAVAALPGHVHGHEPGGHRAPVRLDDQVGDALGRRVDDDVGEGAVVAVGAGDGTAELELHALDAAGAPGGGQGGAVRRPTDRPRRAWRSATWWRPAHRARAAPR